MNQTNNQVIDVHMHVGLMGDEWPELGQFSDWYKKQIVYKTFLLYARIKEHEVTDPFLKKKTLEVISESEIGKVVCLALDPVYDPDGNRRTDRSHVWVDNDYIVDHLIPELPDRILLGASVHPYDAQFQERVKNYVDKGAVLLKWLPSAQHIDLAEDKTRDAMISLAKAKPGEKPLPLLLHIGTELAIPSTDEGTNGYNCLSWTWRDRVANAFRGEKRWYTPEVEKIHNNLKAALEEGAVIIFAHCGLPYFLPRWLDRIFEHSEFDTVRDYLNKTANNEFMGKCFTDVSAVCTPFRRGYFSDISKLPPGLLLFGSDFPTPAFELAAGPEEFWADFKAVLDGDFDRIVIPQDNLLDVNRDVLQHFFPNHPMFGNFSQLM